jgi:hypothetical protein
MIAQLCRQFRLPLALCALFIFNGKGFAQDTNFISSQGCEARRDRLHFTPAGYRELGKRYGAEMLSLLGHKMFEGK